MSSGWSVAGSARNVRPTVSLPRMVTSSRTPTVPMTTEAVGAVVAVARQ